MIYDMFVFQEFEIILNFQKWPINVDYFAKIGHKI